MNFAVIGKKLFPTVGHHFSTREWKIPKSHILLLYWYHHQVKKRSPVSSGMRNGLYLKQRATWHHVLEKSCKTVDPERWHVAPSLMMYDKYPLHQRGEKQGTAQNAGYQMFPSDLHTGQPYGNQIHAANQRYVWYLNVGKIRWLSHSDTGRVYEERRDRVSDSPGKLNHSFPKGLKSTWDEWWGKWIS